MHNAMANAAFHWTLRDKAARSAHLPLEMQESYSSVLAAVKSVLLRWEMTGK
jgi:hypothetical protein